MILTGKPLDPSDGTSCQFELDEIVNVFKNDDVLYLWGNIPLVLSSVTHPELTSAQARIHALETELAAERVANETNAVKVYELGKRVAELETMLQNVLLSARVRRITR